MKKIVVILKEDLALYPPTISLILALTDLGYEVIHLGEYTDQENKKKLINRGVKFIHIMHYDGKSNLFYKLKQQLFFRKKIGQILEEEDLTDNYVWIIQSETICLLYKLVYKYNCILQMLEFVSPKKNIGYKLISPFFNVSDCFNAAKKVVCCEYNRAQITKGMYGLNRLPCVLPNKPYTSSEEADIIPSKYERVLQEAKELAKGKKVILYQGVFQKGERKLDEFINCIGSLPDEYVFWALGKENETYNELKAKYSSNRVHFFSFLPPPIHLNITKYAHIGILTYFPNPKKISSVINPLYCAPNKIFEYSKFGIPMIGNDIPGLYYTFSRFNCGLSIEYPLCKEKIIKSILKIDNKYSQFSEGALEFYHSVNVKAIIENILNSDN